MSYQGLRCQLAGLAALLLWPTIAAPAYTKLAWPIAGFACVNGVTLAYLDYGGVGVPLIFIPGLAASPHSFDDIAPEFIDHYHVFAYARRGTNGSTVSGPYDKATLTEDLRTLMDALKLRKASLVGFSAGGDEATEMAEIHPERVDRIIYLEAGYDWSDPDYKSVRANLPSGYDSIPASALSSFAALAQYQKGVRPHEAVKTVEQIAAREAEFHDKFVLQADGTLRPRVPNAIVDSLFEALWNNKRRDYSRVRVPVLAIFAQRAYDADTPDLRRRAALEHFEETYWAPFQIKSIERLRRELANVEIIQFPGTHGDFRSRSHHAVIGAMRRFLLAVNTAR
jgi:pimeloyl-ACP methyl ester carboxylesterase